MVNVHPAVLASVGLDCAQSLTKIRARNVRHAAGFYSQETGARSNTMFVLSAGQCSETVGNNKPSKCTTCPTGTCNTELGSNTTKPASIVQWTYSNRRAVVKY